MTKKNQALIVLKEKGYTIKNGKVYSPDNVELTLKADENGYLCFNTRLNNNQMIRVRLHRYIAYLKYGNDLFQPGLQVRHLDGNQLNNKFDNIGIGTCQQNNLDKDINVRLQSALVATSHVKIHDHVAILKRRNEGATYKELMEEFGITSKGTISFIVNKSHDLVK